MNISLTPELEAMINRKVKSGMYGSASEVVRESLRRMFKDEEPTQRAITEEQRQKMEELREEVLKGVEAMREGNYRTYNSADEMMEDIIKEARQEFDSKRKNGK